MFHKLTTAAILTSALLAAAPRTASAGRFDTHRERGHDREDYRPATRVDVRVGGGSYERVSRVIVPPPVCEERVWAPSVCRTVSEQVWVPATYTTVVDRVWIEPVVQKVEERTWIGDRYEVRDVTHWENGYRVTRPERVLVEAGHYATVSRDVVLVPGRYEDRPRQQLVCAGHYQTVTREEVLVAGHWEMRPTRVVVASPPRDQFHFDLRIGR